MTDEVVSEVKPLSAILDSNATSAPADTAPKADPKPAPEPAKGDNDGGTPPPKVEDKKPEPVRDDPIKAMRKALKATQRELAQLRQDRDRVQQQAPDPIADPQAYQQYTQESVASLLHHERLATYEEAAREKHGDEAVETALETFREMVIANPALFAEADKQRNPFKFIMKAVEDAKLREEMGDPKAYADKIRADTRKEMMVEVEKLVEEGIRKALGQRLPQSLADEQTQSGGRIDDQPTEFRRKSLDSILNKRK